MRAVLSVAIALVLAGAARAAPPNIVLIFSDDHAYQAISAYGDARKLLSTPNLDRLAKEGVRFDRCLVPNSICGPSRATVLTGKYSHANGFYDNSYSKFDGTQVTFPKLLQKAGYQTAVVGKWHLISEPTGFDFWHILPGQGVYYNPPMIRNGVREKNEGYVTDIITQSSLDWLKARDKDKPFLLMCQHKAPHREWCPAIRHLGHDKDRKYPEPETLFDDYAGRGPPEKNQDMTIAKTMTDTDLKFKPPGNLTPAQKKEWDAYYEPRNKSFADAKLEGKDLVRWKYNRYLHDYLGCIKSVDESVGQVLDYLGKEGLAENTIVVYASDQGFFLGEHGWFDKRWIFEESLRTPMLVRWPGKAKAGLANADIVSTLDLAPTFLTAAGVAVPEGVHGKDLSGVLKGETPKDWRKSFYYHYYEHPGPHDVPRHYGIVTDRYKLVHFYEKGTDLWEMFDRKTDPNEMLNVYEKPEHAAVRARLHIELKQLRSELKVPDSDPAETIIAPPKKK